MTRTVRIAMWSGPRNLSTTMMRSFGARSDTACIDEPFYAAYLAATGLPHPMAEAVMAAGECDPLRVADALAGPAPRGAAICFQKHITKHLIGGFPRAWMASCRHAFLIRHPARVLHSYARKAERPSLHDLGFEEQARIFAAVNAAGPPAPVIDADDILSDPAGMLRALCAALDIPWTDAMLSWAPGPRPEDGVWAPHWYDAVWRSSGFGPPAGPLPDTPEDLRSVLEAALPIYARLAAGKLAPVS